MGSSDNSSTTNAPTTPSLPADFSTTPHVVDLSAVPIFNGEHFSSWRFNLKVYMMERDLWGFFDGSASKPTSDASTAEKEAWVRKDKKAFAFLVSKLSLQLVPIVSPCIDREGATREAWKRLEGEHVSKSLHSKLQARLDFFTVRMRDGESMRSYVNRVEELGERLVELDASVEDNDWIMTLLAGLGEAWSTVITMLDGTQDTWKKEQVVARLINEEARRTKLHGDAIGAAQFSRDAKAKGTSHFKRRNDGNNRGSSSGSAAASRGGSANANRARTRDGACRFCKKTGHWWRECPVKPANWKPSSDDNRRAHVATCDNNDREFVFVASGTTVGGVDAWVLDTGATQHMTACAALLNNVTTEAPVKRVMFGNRDTLDVTGQGDLRLMVDGGPLTIKNVLVGPRWRTADGVHIGTARQTGGLFMLDALPSVATAQAATSTTTLKTWHNRFGHLHHDAIQAMATKGIVNGLEFVRSGGDDEKCVGCLEGKMARKPFPPSTKPNATEPLKLVHTDLCAPITPASKGGARYVLTLLDDATRMCWIRLLKHKDATPTAIKQWVADVETESGFKVKRFRSDGGGEYTARELGDWLKGRGTAHEFSTPYTPQQNGAAEKNWWGEAVTLATWIRNRCVTKALPNKTPLEAWSGTKPDVTDLRTFGCTCYYHVPDATRTKLEAKARVAMYLGPSADHKGWRVWDLEHGKLVVSRDVVFYEDTFPSKSTNVPSVIIVPPPLDAADEADEAPTAPPPSASEGEHGSGTLIPTPSSMITLSWRGTMREGETLCVLRRTPTPRPPTTAP
ncbi:unnamed protein product [Closterium sp. Yama58-4]|nr:unnamed protein product [Closterium sp. Yama58-4]